MTFLDRAVLKVTGDPDGTGTKTAEFNMVGNLKIGLGQRTGFLVGGKGSSVNSVVGEDNRSGVYIDLGGGQHMVEVDFTGWDGATDPNDGSSLRWGASGKGGTKYDATGEDAKIQMNVLDWWLVNVTIDSRSPATLEYGLYSTNGRYDPLDVVIEQPKSTVEAESSSLYKGKLRLIDAADLNKSTDAESRTEQ